MPSISDLKSRILGQVAAEPGRIWSWSDFLQHGSREAIDNVISRLSRQGAAALDEARESGDWKGFFAETRILRIDRGLYHSPSMNRLTKRPTSPDVYKVAEAVLARDGARFQHSPAVAAHLLGITPLVPAVVEIETDARIKPITVGKTEIRFPQRSVGKMTWAGRPAGVVVQALTWARDLLAGEGDEPARVRGVVGAYLAARDDAREDLAASPDTVPGWMRDEIDRCCREAGAEPPFSPAGGPTP